MQNMKALAYRFLSETQIKELNISIGSLKKELKRQSIFLLKYSEFETIQDTIPAYAHIPIKTAMSKNEAISVLSDSITFVLYSDDLPYGRKSQRIYHELGHIKAEHKRSGLYTFEANEEQEHEADVFSLYVMAPPCIIKEIGLSSADDISCLTGLDYAYARKALALIKKDKGNKSLHTEKTLLRQFEQFINANKSNKLNIKKYLAAGTIIIAVCCVSFCFYLRRGQDNASAQNAQENYTSTSTAAASAFSPSVTASQPTLPPEEKMTQNNITVWKAKTGDVYHTDPNCYHIPKTAYTMNLKDAINVGYRKCKDCKD